MVVRLNKLHALVLVFCFLCVSFFFAVRAERKATHAAETPGRNLPVVMYHHITEKPGRAGKYVITANELRRDLEKIQQSGYVTVTVRDLIDYVDGKKQLPEKIIMLTFDDGFESVRELAWPLLKEKQMCAEIFAVGSITETYSQNHDRNVNYAYLNWDDLRELDESEEFEVHNHTYDMHSTNNKGRKGLSRKRGESPIDYEETLKDDLLHMQELLKSCSGVESLAIAYPFGSYSNETLGIVRSLGFKSSFVCEERINRIVPGDSSCLFDLGRYNRPSGVSTDSFFERLMK